MACFRASCPGWFHAIAYIAVSILLAICAIFSISQLLKTRTPPSSLDDLSSSSSSRNLSTTHAAEALLKSGYIITASLLNFSSHRLLPPSGGTLFAISDASISNISISYHFVRDLFLYHTSPKKLSLKDLLHQQSRTCILTLIPNKNLVITNTGIESGTVEINWIPISHPDIYVDGSYAIHGILRPFYNPTQSPVCNSNWRLIDDANAERKFVSWYQIIELLRLKGFVSFSTALHSVLDGILRDFGNLSSVTIFAPRDYRLSYMPSPLMERIVRIHILPRRFSYRELEKMPEKSVLQTLINGRDLKITRRANYFEFLEIDGVEVPESEIFSMSEFVIHGVSKAFEKEKISV